MNEITSAQLQLQHPLLHRILAGDRRAVARAMSLIENDAPDKSQLLKSLYPYAGRAHIVGFTGSPGAGKSTLVDQVITSLRREGLKVGVLAVDPSSPFTGGALLGDRVRMTNHSADPGVYIRSMGSRGGGGGLAKASRDMLYALEADSCDVILLETVGVGQSELDVMSVADTVALVLTPGAGDSVQTAKSGIMEIADVFIVNKSDIPGADALRRDIQLMLHERRVVRENWQPPVIATSATQATGITELWRGISCHRQHLVANPYWIERRKARHRADVLNLLEGAFSEFLKSQTDDEKWRKWLGNLEHDPFEVADLLMNDLPWLKSV